MAGHELRGAIPLADGDTDRVGVEVQVAGTAFEFRRGLPGEDFIGI